MELLPVILIAGFLVTPLIIYFNSAEYKAKKKFKVDQKLKEQDKEMEIAYAYFEREEELKKRIKELEVENELLRNSIKYGNTAFEKEKDNSLFWFVIIILVGIIVYMGLQLNEQYQTFNFINQLFK